MAKDAKRKVNRKERVNKNEFLERVARKTGYSLEEVHTVYDMFVSELQAIVCDEQDLSLTGFGVFSLKKHKGHPVQFDAVSDTVSDYMVLKFTASDVLMTKIRDAYARGNASAVR